MFCSIRLDTKDRSETGIKSFLIIIIISTFGSREVFFKRGLTMAAFIQEGKMPVDKDVYNGSDQRNNLVRTFKQQGR